MGKATSHVVNSIATFHLTLLASFCGDLAVRLQARVSSKSVKFIFREICQGSNELHCFFFPFHMGQPLFPFPFFLRGRRLLLLRYTEREREKGGGKGGGEFPPSLLRGNSRREEPAAISFSIRLPSPFPHLTFPNIFSPCENIPDTSNHLFRPSLHASPILLAKEGGRKSGTALAL